MTIDLAGYSGACGCGKTHALLTNIILIERGATAKLAEIARELALPQGGVIVCDSNTHPYADSAAAVLGTLLHGELPVAQLAADGLHADEKATAALAAMLPRDVRWLLAAGAGTIHDTTRYVANERGIPFLSFPTAATVDGFVSTVSAMTWHGFKKTLPGVAPLAVVADTDIFAAAPRRLTAAGVGDALGKYTSLLDWEIAHLVCGEHHCERIAAITREAADKVRGGIADIAAGGRDGAEQLMAALLLSGIAMQLMGNSRPASGAEHHISHLWEMEVVGPHTDAMHGEKVGVGLLLALGEYRRLAAADLTARRDYAGLPHELLRGRFGGLYDDIAAENTPDLLAEVEPDQLEAALPRIRALVGALPAPDKIAAELARVGGPTTVAQLGLPEEIVADSLALSPFVRRRLTLMRLRGLLVEH